MLAALLGIPHLDYLSLTTFFLVVGIVEYFVEYHDGAPRKSNDVWLEIVSTAQFFLYKPLIVFLTGTALLFLFPAGKDALSHWPSWLMFTCVILGDDLVQYWYHRAAHSVPFLWKLHRAHHSAPKMGFSVTTRNATLYYILMPNMWINAVLIYLGMGTAFVVYTIAKLLIVISAHSHLRWDRMLYQNRWLRPLAWLVERTISTPATHFAHHGLSAEDGISHPNGNFSNMFFFWDVLFGTAKITREYPTQFGVHSERGESWGVQLYYPLIRSKDPQSELR